MVSRVRPYSFGLFFIVLLAAATGYADSASWTFDDPANYTFSNSDRSEVASGVTRLTPLDQTDNDNDSDNGFDAGIHSDTEWDTGNDWLELTETGQANGSGDFTSRVLDAGGEVSWETLTWTPQAPYCKELPDSAQTENAYAEGNADMTGNTLLLHLNEAAGATSFSDTSGNSNDASCSASTCPTAEIDARLDTGIDLDGTDDFLTVSDAASLDFTSGLTIEFWLKLDTTFDDNSDYNIGLVDKGGYQLFLDKSDGKLKFSLADAAAATTWSTSYDGSADTMESLAVFDGKLYAGQGNDNGEGDVLVFDGSSWSTSHNGSNNNFTSLAVYNGALYTGEGRGNGDGDVLVTGGNEVVASSETSWSTDWHHVAATFDGSTLALYVDGTLSNSESATFTIDTNDEDLLIGKGYGSQMAGGSGEQLPGLLDELALYNEALSASEATDRYERGALCLQFQVRSCDDAACDTETFIGPDGTNATFLW